MILKGATTGKGDFLMIKNNTEMVSNNTVIISNNTEMIHENKEMVHDHKEMVHDNNEIINNSTEMNGADHKMHKENSVINLGKTNMPDDKCIPQETVIKNVQLAQAYVPFQKLCTTFSPEGALMRGTAFPQLFDNYSREKGLKVVEDE